MRNTQQFSVTLTHELADMVKSKVSSGEYASESEVIRDGLRALQAQDRALERWLQSEVVAAYDSAKSNPEAGHSPDETRAQIREWYKQAKGRG